MKVMEALSNRRAVRAFRSDAVDREVLGELVSAAVTAPSYMNLQPWSFTVVSGDNTVANLGREARKYLREHLGPTSPFNAAREEIYAPQYETFYGAPALVLISATMEGELAQVACAMAAHGLMLAAHTMGLGTCFVSHALPWLKSAQGRAALGIPQKHLPVAPVIVGCPAADPVSPGRFTPTVHWIDKV